MPVINEVITIEQAIQRNLATWDVVISNFGIDAEANPIGEGARLTYPSMPLLLPGLPSLAAIAIGPRSSFDRCWVLWDPQFKVNSTNSDGAIPDFYRRLSIDAPLLFPQLGNQKRPGDAPAPAPALGLQCVQPVACLRVAASPQSFAVGAVLDGSDDNGSVYAPLTFIPGANSSSTPIETDIADNDVRLRLHLVCYLQPPLFPPPTKRFPFQRRIPLTLGGLSPLTSAFAGIVPVHGRKHIRILFESTSPSTTIYSAIVGGLVSLEGPPTSSPVGNMPTDFLLGSVSAVDPTSPETLVLENPCVDYLTFYATGTAAGGPVYATVFAYD